jgi:hypothetical protein
MRVIRLQCSVNARFSVASPGSVSRYNLIVERRDSSILMIKVSRRIHLSALGYSDKLENLMVSTRVNLERA